VFDDAPLDQAVEGIVNGIFFNQGHVCCAGSRLLVQESVADEVLAKLKRRIATLRVGDPLDKNTDIGAINSAEQLAASPTSSKAASRKARRCSRQRCKLPSEGLLLPSHDLRRRQHEPPHRPRGDLRPRAQHADLPHARRSGRKGQQHRLRPQRRRLDRQGSAHPQNEHAAQSRRRLGEHLQQV
jgi:hypothetical protein